METVKLERYNNAFMEQLNIIFGTEIKNPILKKVVVNAVKITNDLSFAKVYYTVLDDDKKEKTKEALDKAAPFIRKQLASRIEIRHTPELRFIYDTSIAYGEHIENIIKELNKKDNQESFFCVIINVIIRRNLNGRKEKNKYGIYCHYYSVNNHYSIISRIYLFHSSYNEE